MDIQTRKIEFVQAFLKLQSEEIISQFENLLKSKQKNFKTFNIEEFNQRIEKSLSDSKNDRITENSELIEEIKEWS